MKPLLLTLVLATTATAAMAETPYYYGSRNNPAVAAVCSNQDRSSVACRAVTGRLGDGMEAHSYAYRDRWWNGRPYSGSRTQVYHSSDDGIYTSGNRSSVSVQQNVQVHSGN